MSLARFAVFAHAAKGACRIAGTSSSASACSVLGIQTRLPTRCLTTSAARDYQASSFVEYYGAAYADQKLDTALLLETLQNVHSLRSLKPNGSNSREYKAALRAISQIASTQAPTGGSEIRVGDIEAVLSLENGVMWRLIREMIEYGFSSELESLTEVEKAVVRLNRVHGFGRVKAEGYVQAGARTFQDLMQSTDKEYGRKVSGAQKLALTFNTEMEQMISRPEIAMFDSLISEALQQVDVSFKHAILGSYRRGEAVCSDIDLVIWHPSLVFRDDEKRKPGVRTESLMGSVKAAMQNAGLLHDDKIFSQGEKKILALTRLPSASGAIHRQLDIRLCPLHSLPYMLLGNSGDDVLMKLLRWKAAEKGWVLNEYGMGKRVEGETTPRIKEGTEIIVKTEEEIFRLLEVPYIPPTERSYHKYKNRMRKEASLQDAPTDVFEP